MLNGRKRTAEISRKLQPFYQVLTKKNQINRGNNHYIRFEIERVKCVRYERGLECMPSLHNMKTFRLHIKLTFLIWQNLLTLTPGHLHLQ